jgi:hypothetical protein
MTFDINTLIWLFPVAFMLHDFEELIFFEPWLKKNASVVTGKLRGKVPGFVDKTFNSVAGKTTGQLAFLICLIFVLISVSAFVAATLEKYALLLIASSLFLVHGFLHLGQAILLRRYVPSLITALLVVIPYGTALLWRLTVAGVVSIPEVLEYFAAAIILGVPFIMVIHAAGDRAYRRVMRLLVG